MLKDVMRHPFYDSEEYRSKQSAKTKRNQEKGMYAHLRKEVARICARKECHTSFLTQPASLKKYCSQSCAATNNNSKRRWSPEIRLKISNALKGRKNPREGIYKSRILVPRSVGICLNLSCQKTFSFERYKKRKFCSSQCASKALGSRPTSPKASRGKAGIRLDISPDIYFYSRWEANMARLYTYLGIKWIFEPQTFDIGNQTYTPDFYLPEKDVYIEVKNFWGNYSRIRDTKFRNTYPHLQLEVILKEEYQALEEQYAHLIPEWEYKNSVFK